MRTPGQLQSQGEIYFQLGQFLSSGIGLRQGVEFLLRQKLPTGWRAALLTVQGRVDAGATFAEGLKAAGRIVPEFDRVLLESGELSGRLDHCLKLLARHYQERAAAARRLLGGLAYPAFLLHFAVLILPLPGFFAGGSGRGYLATIALILTPLYFLGGLLFWASQAHRPERFKERLERLILVLPVLGALHRSFGLARIAAALESLIHSGINIVEAWTLAAGASGSPLLQRVVASWQPLLAAGETPGTLLQQTPLFQPVFADLYRTGEVSGQLETTLQRLHHYYEEETSRRVKTLSVWVPILGYLLVALGIAWQIIRFWSGYFNQINEVMG